jgi:hypothetical protein
VAHIYSGGRDQERILVRTQPRQIALETLSQKKKAIIKNVEWLKGVGPEFKPQYPPHKKVSELLELHSKILSQKKKSFIGHCVQAQVNVASTSLRQTRLFPNLFKKKTKNRNNS